MFIGYLIAITLVSTWLVKLMAWLIDYSKRKLYQGAIKS
jgi:hypothetical protein